jgi:hypothetical protein
VNTFHQLGSALGLGVLIAVAATAGHGLTTHTAMLAAHVQAALTAGSCLLTACLLVVLSLIVPASLNATRRRIPAARTPTAEIVHPAATEGRGLVQARGQQIVELSPGDVVFTPDGEEHWHGARPDHFMSHLSITEGAPTWGPHVTDGEYSGQPDQG